MEMKIDIDVDANITRVELPDSEEDELSEEDFNDEGRPEGAKFRVRLLLENTLMIIEVTPDEYHVTVAQCFYYEGLISFHETEAHLDHLERMVYDILRHGMNMEEEAAREARSDVARAITGQIQSFCRVNYSMSYTIFMDVDINCTITERRPSLWSEFTDEHGCQPNEPTSEHGSAGSEQCLEGDVCAICYDACSTTQDIITTTCQHIYHRFCILEWLNRGTNTCPLCRSDLSHMFP